MRGLVFKVDFKKVEHNNLNSYFYGLYAFLTHDHTTCGGVKVDLNTHYAPTLYGFIAV